jgi:capsular polysaccharide biosynthesis protein
MREEPVQSQNLEQNDAPMPSIDAPDLDGPAGEFACADGILSMSYGTMTLAEDEPPAAVEGLSVGRIWFALALFILPALSLSVIGGLASLSLPRRYAASTDLIIHMQQPGDAVQRYYASQNLIMKAPSLLEPVSASVHLPYEELSQHVSVDFPKGSNIMRVRYEDTDPQQALAVLQKILAAYESAITPIELDENVIHQVVSAPTLLKDPVFPVPAQFEAIGGAIGLVFSMLVYAILSLLRRPKP